LDVVAAWGSIPKEGDKRHAPVMMKKRTPKRWILNHKEIQLLDVNHHLNE
jgi:hypothetical protein